ncbi:MFS-type transporter SLC18B1-like [Convolutriloba macropyga]|uniref:MFS-type transporter SLC18B1-like n=1 Tax=Convolutriloba macropyga TaxID=536237 RepID=UPI003F522D48
MEDYSENRSYRCREILTVILALSYQFLFGIYLTITEPLFPLNADEKGISRTVVGLISGSSDIASALCGLLFPQIVHLINMKTFFWIGLGLLACSNLLFGLITFINVNALYITSALILRILIGIGYSACWASLFPILLAIYPERTGLMSGLTVIAFESGSILGPIAASVFYKIHGFSLPYLVTGSLGLVVTVMCILFMLPQHKYRSDKSRKRRENRKIAKPKNTSEGQPLVKSQDFSNSSQKNSRLMMKTVCTSSKIAICTIPYAINYSLLGVLAVFFSPFLLNVVGVEQTSVGLYFIPHAVLALIFSPLVGYLVDLKFKWTIFFISPVLGILGCLLLAVLLFYSGHYSNVFLFSGLILARGVSYITGYVAGLVILHDVFEQELATSSASEYRFLMSAWTNTWSKAGVTFGSIFIGGFVFDFLGYKGAIAFECGMFTLSIILSVVSYWLVSVKGGDSKSRYLKNGYELGQRKETGEKIERERADEQDSLLTETYET